MSFFTDASFVMDPNVYGVGKLYVPKPTDGSGDLTFSRASTGTRVNQDGLIEKVRTNLLQQSNSFSATWGANNVTLASGQSGYDGSNDAWLLTATGTTARLEQSVSANLNVFSIYAKAGTTDGIALRIVDGGLNPYIYWNLNDGSFVGTSGGGGINPSTQSVADMGGGWYRIQITTALANTAMIYVADSSGNLVTSGNILIQNAQLEAGDIATDYIPTTTSAVSVGPLANIPRLNYGSDGCPSLLLEPQRTNVVPYSEQLSQWHLAFATLTSNDAISPDGYQNADKIVTTSAGCDVKYSNVSVSASTTYTASFWVKLTNGSGLNGRFYDNTNGANIEYYTYDSQLTIGEWSRVTRTFTTPAGCTNIQVWYLASSSSSSVTAHFWGFQLEEGAYATSYIPTLSTSVTRLADSTYKTGMSSVIGQTEGTLFVDINISHIIDNEAIGTINSGGYANNTTFQRLGNTIQFVRSSSTQSGASVVTSSSISVGRYKMAIAYKSGDTAFFLNGVQVGTTQTQTFTNGTLSVLRLGGDAISALPISDTYNQTLLFPTRLSNADLARLTSL